MPRSGEQRLRNACSSSPRTASWPLRERSKEAAVSLSFLCPFFLSPWHALRSWDKPRRGRGAMTSRGDSGRELEVCTPP